MIILTNKLKKNVFSCSFHPDLSGLNFQLFKLPGYDLDQLRSRSAAGGSVADQTSWSSPAGNRSSARTLAKPAKLSGEEPRWPRWENMVI